MEDVNEVQESTEQTPVEVVTETVPGEKTDSALLLKSLQEERDKRRDLEAEIATLKTQPVAEVFSDEGKLLADKIARLEQDRDDERRQNQMTQVQLQYPAIKDKSAEFDNYLAENPGMRLEVAAKSFLVENNLFESQPRKGLERQTGGGRVSPKEGMSVEDITDLRTNNFRKYAQLLREGKIKVD